MMVAALTGDALAFRSGRRYGPRVRAGPLGAWAGEARWAKADSMLHRLGGRGVLAARWVPFARTLMPRHAGSAGMRYRRFAPWNLAGVVSWVGASVLVGYLAGTSYETVSEILGRATGAVLVLLGCVLAIVLVGRWLGRNPDPARALVARAGALPPLRWIKQRYGVLFFLLSMQLGPGWAFAVNLIAGLTLLFAVGLALAWLVRAVVDYSGLSVVDVTIARWFADQRADGVDDAAQAVVSVLRGSVLITVVALLAIVLGWRARAWRGDLVSMIGRAGAFLPLVVLALIVNWLQPDPGGSGRDPRAEFLPTQNTVVTASLCTIAWLVARHSGWPRAVAAWTCAAAGIVTISGARLYLGSDSASATVTSVLLGVLWTAVFMVAWATRGRAARADRAAHAGRTGPDRATDQAAG
jgi:hypothetical protein